METLLINYRLDGSLIDYKVVSYDEIAEGWSKIESLIEANLLTITRTTWYDVKVEETKMQPNVPNQEHSTDGFTIMSESEISDKLDNIVYKPKKPKGK